MSARNTKISIVKGIAIILMVIGHAEAPGFLISFIYTFHMPIFFITAGYFLSKKHIDNPWDFCKKRFSGLYVPFVKWSIFFLLIHNLLFHFDILNETYGNWSGGVTHPYTLHIALQRLANIVFAMGGYDEFLAGAFWFFRALLISSIAFLVFYRLLIGKKEWLTDSVTVAIICVACIAFAIFKINFNLQIPNIVQHGIRETMGIMFFGMGVLFRRYEHLFKEHWAIFLLYFSIICSAAALHLQGMTLSMHWYTPLTLTLTGFVGFLMVRYISGIIDQKETIVKRFLVYCGETTLYIYVFHIISFKIVSLIKIWWYGLDFKQIGCHMVIHDYPQDGFWILYSIVGVCLPLAWIWTYRRIFNKVPNSKLMVPQNKVQ